MGSSSRFPQRLISRPADTRRGWVESACLSRDGISFPFLETSKVGGPRHFDGVLPLASAWESDEGNGLPFGHTFGGLNGDRREPHPTSLLPLRLSGVVWGEKSGPNLNPSFLWFLAG